MFDEETSDDMNAGEAAAMGGKRFANMSLFDSPILIPPDPAWTTAVREQAEKQLAAAIDPTTLLCGYIELLGRAKALADFWDNNVGPTEDWPISVLGDTEEVEACLLRRVSKLRSAVNFVEESACS